VGGDAQGRGPADVAVGTRYEDSHSYSSSE